VGAANRRQLFFDEDGKTYLSVARPYPSLCQRFNLGSFCTEIDLATGSSLRPSVLMRTSDTEIPVAEGPHIFKRNGIYYLIVAEGGTEIIHQEWIMRSATGPLGPWEVAPTRENDANGVNPLVFNGDDSEVNP
jgi:beta-xylosidase